MEIRIPDHRVSSNGFRRGTVGIDSNSSVQCSLLSVGRGDVPRPARLAGHCQVPFKR